MWRLIFTLFSILAMAFNFGCTHRDKDLDGIEVGNGLKLNHYSTYKFQVSYDRQLFVKELSAETFYVETRNRLDDNSDRGRLTFQVSKTWKKDPKGAHLEKLESELKTKEQSYERRAFRNASGYCNRSMSCLIVTPRGDLITTSLAVSPDPKQMKRFHDVLDSFSYDETPPLVEDIKVVSNVVFVESDVRFVFKATDEPAGIMPKFFGTLIPEEKPERAREYPFSTFAVPFGGKDSYLAVQQINEHAVTGKYYLNFTVCDNLANCRSLKAPALKPGTNVKDVYQIGGIDSPLIDTNIPVVRVEVRGNPHFANAHSPTIREFRIEPSWIEAGNWGHLIFKATGNNNSGVSNFSNYWAMLSPSRENAPFSSTFFITGLAKTMDPETYSVPFQLSRYLQSGDYFASLGKVMDGWGNATKLVAPLDSRRLLDGQVYRGLNREVLPVVQLHILNNNTADILGPFIKRIALSPKASRGKFARLSITATDDLSGIDPFISHRCTLIPEGQGPFSNGRIDAGGSLKSLGDDAYDLDFDVPHYASPGVYFLQKCTIFDVAGNHSVVQAFNAKLNREYLGDKDDPADASYRGLDGTKSPLIWIEIQ